MSRRRQPLFESLEARQLLAAGALDTSFSGDGKATIDLGSAVIFTAQDVGVQSDGKTVVVGDDSVAGIHRVVAARFNFDGTPDTSFGGSGNGLVRFNIGNVSDDRGTSVAIQGDGKIVIGAFSTLDGLLGDFVNFGVARLNPNGTLDNSFDGDGKRTINFDGFVEDVIIQSDQKIVLVGQNNDLDLNASTDLNFAVARLNPNGSLDNTFDGDGKRQVGFGGNDSAHAVAIDSQGRLVVAGSSSFSTTRSASILRLNRADGSRDASFSGDGQLPVAFPGHKQFLGNAVLIQSGDKIVVGGNTAVEFVGTPNFALARVLPNGLPDTTFGPNGNGFVETDLGGFDSLLAMIRSADGGIIVAGGSAGKFALAAYTRDGILKTSFGNGGKLLIDFGSTFTSNTAGLANGPGRRFVMAGGSQFKTARFLDDGANAVSIAAFDRSASENISDTATLIVGRTESLPVRTRIFFNVSGTATRPGSTIFGTGSNRDYTVSNMTLVDRNGAQLAHPFVDIPANATLVTCTFTAVNDSALEGPETAIFTIAPDALYEIGTPSSGTITIADNDQPPVLNVAPTADAFVRDGTSATTNFGTATELQVKTSSTVGLNREVFFKFDVRTISSVGSAKLQVFARVSDTQDASIQTSLFGLPDTTWSETAITFNARPPVAIPALSTQTITGTTLKLYEFDVTAYLLKERSLKHDLVSFVLKNPNSSESFVIVNSREAASGRPNLLVQASPSVGTFKFAPSPEETTVGTPTDLAIEWNVPQGSWRQLTNIQLRLRGQHGAEILMDWNEADDTLALFDPITGRFGEPMAIGTDAVLSNSLVSISLKRSSVAASGPTSSRVTVTFSLQFKQSKQKWKIDAAASNDLGSQTRFERAGRLTVR